MHTGRNGRNIIENEESHPQTGVGSREVRTWFEPANLCPNLEPDLAFGSAQRSNFEPDFRFGSAKVRFEPKFRTELSHH